MASGFGGSQLVISTDPLINLIVTNNISSLETSSVTIEIMDSNQVIVEGLNLLLEKRQEELASAEAAKDQAAGVLLAASQAAVMARQRVDEVFQMIASHTPGVQGDRDIGSVGIKRIVGPIASHIVPRGALSALPEYLFDSVKNEWSTPLHKRWEEEREQRQYLRRSRNWKQEILKRLEVLLANGERSTASNLYAALEAEGVDFTGISNPTHRLVQIMSADARFEASRAEGWGLVAPDNANDSASPEGAADE